jgi:hypothetical protein
MGDLLDSMLDLMRSVSLHDSNFTLTSLSAIHLIHLWPLLIATYSGETFGNNVSNLRPVRRLPPTKIEANLNALLDLCPEYADDLLGSVDQPLKMLTDKSNGRDYLACDYNRDGDSYR